MVIPSLRTSSSPQTVAQFSLAELGSRDASEAVVTPDQTRPYVLLVDIPADQSFSNYRCEIQRQDGTKVLSLSVSATEAQKPVPLLIPAALLKPDSYRLVVFGETGDTKTSGKEVQHQTFQIK